MKKLLLIALVVSGLAFVPVQSSDAQVYVGIPGIVGGWDRRIPGRLLWLSGVFVFWVLSAVLLFSAIFLVLLHGSLILLVQRASSLLSPPPSSLLPQLLS